MKKKYKVLKRLLAFAYLIAALVYFGSCLVHFAVARQRVASGQMTPHTLTLGQMQLNSAKLLEPENGKERFVSTDSDPQLVYWPGIEKGQANWEEAFYPGRVTFAATPHKPGGEIVAYYSTTPQAAGSQAFDEANKVWAKQAQDGSWYFDFGNKKVYALRIDPDTADDGIIWTVERITFGSAPPTASYFVPAPLTLLLFLVLPGLFVAVLGETRRIIRQGKKLPDDF